MPVLRRAAIRKSKKSREEEEIQVLDTILDILSKLKYEGKMSFGKNLAEAREITISLGKWLLNHFDEEEKILFPYLEVHVPKLEPAIRILEAEHRSLRENLLSLMRTAFQLRVRKNAAEQNGLIEKLGDGAVCLTYFLRNHVNTENATVHRSVRHELRGDEQRELRHLLKEHRGRSGHC